MSRRDPTEGQDMIPTLPALRVAGPVVAKDERAHAAKVLLGENGGADVLANIRHMAQQPTRNAHWASLYAEIVGWKGSMSQLLAWLMGQLGCGLEDAREYVQQVRATPTDPDEIAQMCLAYLARDYYGENGVAGERPEAATFRAWHATVEDK